MPEDKTTPPPHNVPYRLQSWHTHDVVPLVLDTGKCPCLDWLDALRDKKTEAIFEARLRRVTTGHFGNCRDLKGGLWELKINFGPGYRVYYGKDGPRVILLLSGGDKSSQERDIEKSRQFWRAYRESQGKERKDENDSV
jgi:putative addiction module killer protein